MRDFSKNIANLMELGSGATQSVLNGATEHSWAAWILFDTRNTGSFNNNIFSFEVGAGVSGFSANLINSGADALVQTYAHSHAGGSFVSGAHTTVMTAGTLYHVAGACDYTNNVIYNWVNGGAAVTTAVAFPDATYITSAATETDRIGGPSDLPPTTNSQFDGAIGHLAIWTRLLTDTEVAALALGLDPFLIGGVPRFYWPLWGIESPEVDIIQSMPATIAGTVGRRSEEAPIVPYTSTWGGAAGGLATPAASIAVLGSFLRRMAA